MHESGRTMLTQKIAITIMPHRVMESTTPDLPISASMKFANPVPTQTIPKSHGLLRGLPCESQGRDPLAEAWEVFLSPACRDRSRRCPPRRTMPKS